MWYIVALILAFGVACYIRRVPAPRLRLFVGIMVPNDAEIKLLGNLLYGGVLANRTLKLFKNNITPAESDTAATYTESTFTGYAAVTLTSTQAGGTWAVPTTSSGVTTSTYGTNAVFSATSVETAYGYDVVDATSGVIQWSETFASPIGFVNPSTLTITPKFGLE